MKIKIAVMDFLAGMLTVLAQFLPLLFNLLYATGKGATADFGSRIDECLGLYKPVALSDLAVQQRKLIYNKFFGYIPPIKQRLYQVIPFIGLAITVVLFFTVSSRIHLVIWLLFIFTYPIFLYLVGKEEFSEEEKPLFYAISGFCYFFVIASFLYFFYISSDFIRDEIGKRFIDSYNVQYSEESYFDSRTGEYVPTLAADVKTGNKHLTNFFNNWFVLFYKLFLMGTFYFSIKFDQLMYNFYKSKNNPNQ